MGSEGGWGKHRDTKGEVESWLKKAEVDTGLKIVEGEIGMKKGEVNIRVMITEIDTEMIEQLQLQVEPSPETRSNNRSYDG